MTVFQFEDITNQSKRRQRNADYRLLHVRVAGTLLGVIEYRWVRHLRLMAWEATHANGEHRAVHERQEQAAKALAWDGTGYPFPL
jgi:hypothetical protein